MTRILIVEDNEMNRNMLSRRLQKRGFEVCIAEDGQAGVDMTKELMPDVVLMDMSLPVLDGWQATRAIRSDPATVGVPIIALTAHAMPEDEGQALAAGCNDYDTKPIDLPRLLEKISNCLSR